MPFPDWLLCLCCWMPSGAGPSFCPPCYEMASWHSLISVSDPAHMQSTCAPNLCTHCCELGFRSSSEQVDASVLTGGIPLQMHRCVAPRGDASHATAALLLQSSPPKLGHLKLHGDVVLVQKAAANSTRFAVYGLRLLISSSCDIRQDTHSP